MSAFAATTAWLAGELFEARLVMTYGLASLGAGLALWWLGPTPAAKALGLPLLLAGLVYLGVGVSMQVTNRQRQPVFAQQFQQDARQFIAAEKQRVEGFPALYRSSKIVATVCFLFALGAFWLSRSVSLHGWGLGLALFAVVGLAVDYFSEERAATYYQALTQAEPSAGPGGVVE